MTAAAGRRDSGPATLGNAVSDLLPLVVDGFPEPVVVLDTHFRVLLRNAAAENLAPGLTPGKVGPLCCRLIHGRPGPCPEAEAGCALREAALGHPAVTVRHQLQASGKPDRILDITVTPLRRPDGDVAGILQMVRDSTEAVQTRAVISRARNEWLTTADSVPDLILLTDLDQRIVRCNRATRDFMGLDYQDLIGLEMTGAFERLDCEMTVLDDSRAEMHCERPRAILEITSYPANVKGKRYGTVWVMRDVTTVRRLEAIASSVDMNNNLGHVLATVRHELGNPINAIKTALTVLREKSESFSPAKTAEYLDRCLNDVGRVQSLLDNLRTFNMFDSVRCEAVDLLAFLRDLEGLVSEQLRRQGIGFELQCPEAPVEVSADPRALSQVLLGLISNGGDAVSQRSDPRISIAVEREDGAARVAVVDNGAGIPSAELAMAFVPLYTTKPQGTGLGLAIARNLITRMNGTVDLKSTPGRGTRAEITLECWNGDGEADARLLGQAS